MRGVMELLTIQETAQTLKVAPLTVRRYIQSGMLPAVKVGRGIRVRKEALDQLVTDVSPVAGTGTPATQRHGKVFSMGDPLWNVVGIGETEEPTDIAGHKDEYIASAHVPRRP